VPARPGLRHEQLHALYAGIHRGADADDNGCNPDSLEREAIEVDLEAASDKF
jgi:hypothetical protein